MAEAAKKTKLPSGRHRSQIKRQTQNLKKADRNLTIRSEVKTFIKKVREAVEKKDLNLAKESLLVAISKINKAVSSGIFHRNNGSRKISRLSRLVTAVSK